MGKFQESVEASKEVNQSSPEGQDSQAEML